MRQISSSRSIPRTIRPFVKRLGTPRVIYEPYKQTFLARLLGPVGILVGCCILIALYFVYPLYSRWWPLWETTLILVLGLTWIVMSLWLTLASLIDPALRVYFCPKGLIHIRRRIEVIPWNDIEAFWKHIYMDKKMRIVRQYTLQRTDGVMFVFKNELPHVEEFGTFLEQRVVRRLLPRIINRYDTDNAVDFGEITIGTQGIVLKQRAEGLPWNDVARVDVDETTVNIYKKGDYWNWAMIPVAQVPNAGALQGLVEYALRKHAAQPAQVLARMLAAYNAGLPLQFGELSISKQGVGIGGRLLSWREVTSIGVGASEVIVHRRGRPSERGEWYTLPLTNVLDNNLLKKLVDLIVQASAKKTL